MQQSCPEKESMFQWETKKLQVFVRRKRGQIQAAADKQNLAAR
jgi:hypothetical protein